MIGAMQQIRLVPCLSTLLHFADTSFELTPEGDGVRIAGKGAAAVLRPESQAIPSEADVSESIILIGVGPGGSPFESYFMLDWEDHLAPPQVTFTSAPRQVVRRFGAGGALELGLEDVARYRVVYADGVEATIERAGPADYRIAFSTGLAGRFWRDPDGSYTIHFRGDVLPASEEPSRAQSKFIVSRCKFSGNLLLLFQEEAAVHLE